MKKLRIALAQINPTVGDLGGNADKIIRNIAEARKCGAEIVAFPELSITGYPPEDLLLKPQFVSDNLKALKKVAKHTSGITAIVGFVDRQDDIYNAAAVIGGKKVLDVYHKVYLPNYGPFDEFRYFQAGTRLPVYRMGGITFGLNICEDIWYPEGPLTVQAISGAEVVININASPYTVGKRELMEKRLVTRATDSSVIVAYLNAVGGQDELLFAGGSMVINERGALVARGSLFEEDLVVTDLDLEPVFMARIHDPRRRQQALGFEDPRVEVVRVPRRAKRPPRRKLPGTAYRALERDEEIYRALVLGVRDYVRKNGFKGVIIGFSGGIDSSLVATIAVDALGRKNVRGLFMPSPYTSEESRRDSYALAGNLGIELIEISIDDAFRTILDALKPVFGRRKPDATEENIQARIRGNLLMALSNKFGWLVLTTGNKSEMSVGYATLYGDMAGGFAVLKDVAKTMVYRLARWRNKDREVIPRNVLCKEPTAELAPGQKDTDTLPPYPMLDPVLKAYVEDELTFEELLELGCERRCVEKVVSMVDRSEYKRRQAPPGIKITPRAFGKDRRFPITNRYRSY